MKFWKKNDGLTLVELMVSIAIGTMIFAAATTVLLLGIRIHHHTTDSIMQQYTARTVLTMMEQMAEEGSFDKTYRTPDGSWKLGNEIPNDDRQAAEDFENVLLSYCSASQTIFAGDYERTDKTVILENVAASYIVLEDNILTVSLEDTKGTYTSSIYCRITGVSGGKNFNPSDHVNDIIKPGGSEEKQQFLSILNSQIGTRGGIINHDTRTCGDVCEKLCHRYNFFSQWYSNGYDEEYYPGWNTETPWCGCFVSWGLCHASGLGQNKPGWKWFGNVDEFMDYFRKDTTGGWKTSNPGPGDLVFFDMINGTTDNPSHIGAVLDVIREKPDDPASKIIGIKTIEGNSADTVAIREYQIGDKRILGYGDPWAAQAKPNDNT